MSGFVIFTVVDRRNRFGGASLGRPRLARRLRRLRPGTSTAAPPTPAPARLTGLGGAVALGRFPFRTLGTFCAVRTFRTLGAFRTLGRRTSCGRDALRLALLGRNLRIAQQPENAGLHPHERIPRRFFHRRRELSLHRHLGRAPHEGEQLLAERPFRQVFVVQRPPFFTKDIERCLEESHGARLYHETATAIR